MKRVRIAIAIGMCALLCACAAQPVIPVHPDEDKITIIGQLDQPTEAPTPQPHSDASNSMPTPTPESTEVPTPEPTAEPTATPEPTAEPTATPEPTAMPSPTPTPVPDRTKAEAFCDAALALLDVPYQRGGTDPESGFDPGGFVFHCLNAVGVKVGHKTSKGYSEKTDWQRVDSMEDLEIGDLCFFQTPNNDAVNCVTIYLGDGKMIYPSSGEGKVITAKISTNYWKEAFVFARRVF